MNHPLIAGSAMRVYPAIIVLLLIALVLATADLLIVFVGVLLLVFAGLLFGIFTHALATWPAQHSPLSYRVCYLAVVMLMLVSIGLGIFYFGAQATQQMDELSTQLQSSIETADERLKESDLAQQYLPSISEMQSRLADSTGSILPKMFQGLRWISWALTGAMVIFFVGLYAAYDPDLYRTGLVKLVPKQRRERANEVLDQLRSALGLWLVGRLISMTMVGVATGIGLSMLGVPLPISLGFLAALLTFIPNIGPLLAALPQMLLALNEGTDTVVYVIVFNVVLQTLESYLVTPLVQRHEVSLPPILTIAAQLIMGVGVGIIGMMLAAPLVVVAMVLLQMLYVQDYLGDDHPGQLTNG